MEARSEAMDELADTGAFDDALSDEDEIDKELRSTRTDSEIEAELDTLRAEMGEEAAAGANGSEAEVEPDSETAESESADPEVEAELEDLREEES
jgi:phage shock protein A